MSFFPAILTDQINKLEKKFLEVINNIYMLTLCKHINSNPIPFKL